MSDEEVNKPLNSREDIINEIQKSERKLKELRNLQEQTRSKIFVESAFVRYMKDRLRWVEEGRVSQDTHRK